MNFSVDLGHGNVWQLAGWTMIHFAWIGTALFALTFLSRLLLRRAHPTWRYATTLALFTLLAISPALIGTYLATTWPAAPVAISPPSTEVSIEPLQSLPAEPSLVTPAESQIIELTQLTDAEFEAIATPPEPAPPSYYLIQHPEFTNPQPQALRQNPIPTEPTPNTSPSSSATSAGSVVNPTRAEQLIAALDRVSHYLPWLWLIGAPLTFALLATGLVGGERLRRSAELLTTGPIVDACETLKRQLKITRRVAIAVTDRVAQPVLVGIVRPMILLPWAALHGWRADQIEMVLVHELAHVRRWDNLVNLGQRIVESVLFYHPAVWLVSRWLRHDREECCDAVVVAQTGEPAEYANLLLSVASQLKPRRSLLTASAMAQHPLTRRIRRLLQLEDDPMLVSRTSLLMGVAALVVAAVVAANYPLWAEDEPSPATPADATTREATEESTNGGATTPDQGAEESNSPFLSLEDQRVADLAYNMLGVEVEPLTEKLPPEGRERGFKGGVKVVQFDPHNTRQERNLLFMQGDILVGLHVWAIKDFDSLGEVLRRADLEQFSPLKVYLLRPRKASRAARDAREVEGDNVPEEGYDLITGRMSFSVEAWAQEQIRLGNNPGPTPGQLFRARDRASRQSIDQSPSTVQPNRNLSEENESKAGDLRDLRYDGRSFDEWRTQWRNELKVEERVEAINAMIAFGRAGYGREAAEAIFDVAAQYDFYSADTTSPEWQLIQAVKIAFAPHSFGGPFGETISTGGAISTEIWLNVLAERLESDRDTYLPIAVDLLPRTRLDESVVPLVEKWTESQDEHLRRAAFVAFFKAAASNKPYVDEAFRRALAHKDRQLVLGALQTMVEYQPQFSDGILAPPKSLPIVERLYPEVLETLFHGDETVRQYARWLIAHTDDELAKRFAGDLVKRLEQSKGGEPDVLDTRIAAIRAIGALGPRAKSAMESLKDPKSLFAGVDLPTRAAMAAAMYQILGRSDSGDLDFGELGPVWDAMNEGLDNVASEQLTQTFRNEVTQIYPEGQMPLAMKEVLGYLLEEVGATAATNSAQPPKSRE